MALISWRKYPDKRLALLILVSFAFSVALVWYRVQRTGLVTYYFLIWNLTLAGIPLAIAYLMNAWLKEYRRIFLFYAMGALWLAFYPNAPYIITDFIHLKARHHIPLWFDTLLIFSFAWNGFVAGLISVRYFHLTALHYWPAWLVWATLMVVFGLSSFGIYLGRFLRWNSWDILSNPLPLFSDILDRIANPEDHPRTLALVVLYSAFSFLAYLVILHLPREKPADA